MGTNNNKLFSNFIALSVVQGTNFLLPLVVMPYVIKKIGADGFGVVAVAQVCMLYLSTIADYGFNLSATRDIALYKDEDAKISKIFFINDVLSCCVGLKTIIIHCWKILTHKGKNFFFKLFFYHFVL